MIRSVRTFFVSLLITCSAAAAQVPEISDEEVLTLINGSSVVFFPLNPQIERNESARPIVNIFVRQASFGQYTLSIVPTLAWRLSDEQEKALEDLKQKGITSFAPWPDITATPYLYIASPEGALETHRFQPVSVVLGATTVIVLQVPNLEPGRINGLLYGEEEMGILFSYDVRVTLPPTGGVDDNEWQRLLARDIQELGPLPAAGAVQQLYEALREKYVSEYAVQPQQIRQYIERIVKAVPVTVSEDNGEVLLYHNLQTEVNIELPSAQPAPLTVHDFFQGRYRFGDLCEAVGATVFVSDDRGSSVGCDALPENR